MLEDTNPACQGKVFVQQVPSSPSQFSKNKNFCVSCDLIFTICALSYACEKTKHGIAALADTAEFCDIKSSFCLKPATAHPMPMRVYGHLISTVYQMVLL